MIETESIISSKHVPFPSFRVMFSKEMSEKEKEEGFVEDGMNERRGEEESVISNNVTSDIVKLPFPAVIREEEKI